MNNRAPGARPYIEHIRKRACRCIRLKLLMVRLIEEDFHVQGNIWVLRLELLPDFHVFLIPCLVGLLIVEHIERHFLLPKGGNRQHGDRNDGKNRSFHLNLLKIGCFSAYPNNAMPTALVQSARCANFKTPTPATDARTRAFQTPYQQLRMRPPCPENSNIELLPLWARCTSNSPQCAF